MKDEEESDKASCKGSSRQREVHEALRARHDWGLTGGVESGRQGLGDTQLEKETSARRGRNLSG